MSINRKDKENMALIMKAIEDRANKLYSSLKQEVPPKYAEQYAESIGNQLALIAMAKRKEISIEEYRSTVRREFIKKISSLDESKIEKIKQAMMEARQKAREEVKVDIEEEELVVIARGEKYHKPDHKRKRHKTECGISWAEKISKIEAKRRGYRKCKSCFKDIREEIK